MIYDNLRNIEIYKGLSDRLDRAIDFLCENKLEELADGIYKIDGDSLRVHVVDYETKDPELTPFEAHRKFIDIHIVLSGGEYCYYTALGGLKPSGEFDEENDIGFFESKEIKGIAMPLTPGYFCLVFPEDAHKPSCYLESKKSLRKVVLKIEV